MSANQSTLPSVPTPEHAANNSQLTKSQVDETRWDENAGLQAGCDKASNFAEKKYTVGLDLGDRWSWYCVLDERGDGCSTFAVAVHYPMPELTQSNLRP
jgi:hypothetical protein